MKEIEPGAMLERIRPQRLCYSQEYMDLTQPEMIAKWAVKCYTNGDESCLAVTWKCPSWNVASFIGYGKEFTREVLLGFDACEVSFPLPPGEAMPNIKLHGLKKKGVENSFAYEGPAPEESIDPHIRLLEKEAFEPLRALTPRHDNLNHTQLAFAWLEDGQPLGYLSCMPMAEDIWDVGLIFTLPEYRGRGIATKLAYTYLKTMRERGLVPYYSGVSNPYSAKAAQKAGFQPCCAKHLYNYKRLKFF